MYEMYMKSNEGVLSFDAEALRELTQAAHRVTDADGPYGFVVCVIAIEDVCHATLLGIDHDDDATRSSWSAPEFTRSMSLERNADEDEWYEVS